MKLSQLGSTFVKPSPFPFCVEMTAPRAAHLTGLQGKGPPLVLLKTELVGSGENTASGHGAEHFNPATYLPSFIYFILEPNTVDLVNNV